MPDLVDQDLQLFLECTVENGLPHRHEPNDESGPSIEERRSEFAGIRVISQATDPRCWEHGCRGGKFSTLSNLIRHQREKAALVVRSICPICQTKFTRARDLVSHKCVNLKMRAVYPLIGTEEI